MADDARVCGVCNTPVGGLAQQAPPAGSNAPIPGIPGLPTPGAQPVQPNYLNQGAAPMGGAPAGASGEMRVSLTGEVLEVTPPTPRASAPGGYPRPGVGGKPGAPPLPVRGPAPSRPTGGARPRYGGPPPEESEKSGGMSVWAVVLLLVIVIGGGAGAFLWYQKQQAPKKAAENVMSLLVKKDWGGIYDATEMPDAKKSQFSLGGADPKQAFVGFMNALGALVTFKDPKIGEMTSTGDTASVKVTVTVEGFGRASTETQEMPLKLVNGQWKVDGDKGFMIGSSLAAGMNGGGNGGGGTGGSGMGGSGGRGAR